MFDIGIIGKGPSGISAAITASIRNKSIIMFGSESKKVLSSPIIHNYPGLPEIKGSELVDKLNIHLKSANIHFSDKRVTAVYSMGNSFTVQAGDEMIEAKSIILAAGVDFKKTIEGEDVFLGMGVSYCATCDAPLYRGKNVGVIGYNLDSIEETKFLSEICSKVFFVPLINESCQFSSNVEIIKDSPVKFEGDMQAKKLVLKNTVLEADGFFVLKDSYPLSSLVPGLAVDGPHVNVNRNMETNIKGLFAAGDVTGKPYQIAKAVGEGQVAALSAIEYLAKV